jgi:hypothetical protein
MAMVVMLRGTPAKPLTGSAGFQMLMSSFRTLTWYGRRPLWIEERVGLQYLCT